MSNPAKPAKPTPAKPKPTPAKAKRAAFQRKPPFQPTQQQRSSVSALRAAGTPLVDIATVLRIDFRTLQKAFGRELEHGLTYLRAAVGMKFTERALAGDPYASWKWLQLFGGPAWKEVKRSELTGADGKPIQIAGSMDATEIAAALLAVRTELAARGSRKRGGPQEG